MMNKNISGEFDVIVVGGGIAGVSAAVSAARCRKSVLLIEKSVNLGGLATNGRISWFEPLCDGNGKQMVFGISEELIQLAIKYCFDTLPVEWGGKNTEKHRYASRFSPTVFSMALDEFVIEGVPTTISFNRRVLDNEVFCAGEATTEFIETQMGELL